MILVPFPQQKRFSKGLKGSREITWYQSSTCQHAQTALNSFLGKVYTPLQVQSATTHRQHMCTILQVLSSVVIYLYLFMTTGGESEHRATQLQGYHHSDFSNSILLSPLFEIHKKQIVAVTPPRSFLSSVLGDQTQGLIFMCGRVFAGMCMCTTCVPVKVRKGGQLPLKWIW